MGVDAVSSTSSRVDSSDDSQKTSRRIKTDVQEDRDDDSKKARSAQDSDKGRQVDVEA